MAAQLAWTLASGTTTIGGVQLQINGRPVLGNQYQLPQDFSGWVPTQPAGSSLYFVGSHGVVQELSGIGQPGSGRVAAVPGAAGTASPGGPPALGSIAVSPDRRWVAGITAGGGAVYIGDLSRGARLTRVAAYQRRLHLAELGRAGQSLDRRRRRGLDAAAGRHFRFPGHHRRRVSRRTR